ncbi:hypothetical protein QSV08_15790 [Maribacter sp. BPC-D8]|uniref:hypothetical protein n=1 Tax=Maribacter sp. BPC-D8 TaxID=3053613 RepID=UPI002B4857F0|nr:hypothetical protein [Maribacter sp. BPC-D8]WRI28678.1 hypothetical protein QSV08_15790 [Maribacter sp. BPC-D8]
MKYVLSCFILFCLCLTSCTSQKKLQTETPFEIGKASSQPYVGGREESGSGTELRIPVSFLNTTDIEIKEIYFRGKQVKALVNTVDNQEMIVVRIPNNNPESSETLDLKLNKDEAVISYNEDGEMKYAKINGIKQKQPLIYKGAPKN